MLQRMRALSFPDDIYDDRMSFFQWITSQCSVPESTRTEFALGFMARSEKCLWAVDLQSSESRLLNATLKFVAQQSTYTSSGSAAPKQTESSNKRMSWQMKAVPFHKPWAARCDIFIC